MNEGDDDCFLLNIFLHNYKQLVKKYWNSLNVQRLSLTPTNYNSNIYP